MHELQGWSRLILHKGIKNHEGKGMKTWSASWEAIDDYMKKNVHETNHVIEALGRFF